ncbi:MAG: glycosyltransferase family 4 protein [Anaerolineaceae bacterium]|nr:glycosyltransferase family 4 protein [Anaerolineaceae bacterium]
MYKNIIIIDNQSYPLGGTSQVAYKSAIGLHDHGINVTYLCTDNEPNPDLIKKGIQVVNIYNPGIHRNPNKLQVMINGLWDIHMEKEVRKILSVFNKDDTLIHIHGYIHCFSPSIFRACKQSGIKTVLTLHDYFTLCPCGGLYDFQKNAVCKLHPMSMQCVLNNCDKRNYLQKIWRVIRQIGITKYAKNNSDLDLIYISDFSYAKMKDYIGTKHNEYFVRNPYDVGKESKYIAENNHNYVFMGRITKGKGADIFCKALSELITDKEISGDAVVVGDGDDLKRLQTQFPEIQFLGWKKHDEMDEIYATTRSLVFPSRWYEGAPLTPIEFMSRGIPCIIADSNSGKEYIKNNVDGLLFESENITDLKKKILYAENDNNWRTISEKVRATFNTNCYDNENHIKQLISIYQKISEKK